MTPPDPYAWLYSRTRQGRTRGPARARRLLDALGSPDSQFQSIRVTGTNGKGSTCALLEAGLIAAGHSVGSFTSPHLERFEERVRVNGQTISPDQTAEFIAWAQQHAPDAAFFDLSLGLACQAFARAGVRWAVMEAGVGGVSDATQALAGVRAVLVTNVALDHTATLGPTLSDIARDKAGAALPGVPLLSTATGEALVVVAEVAAEHLCMLHTPRSHPALFALPRPPAMLGPHQFRNAQLAAATLRLLGCESGPNSESGPNFESGLDAALNVTFPARLERFTVAGRTVLLDGAHNPHAAQALVAAVTELAVSGIAVTGIDVLLFGNFARKDTAATLAPLLALTPVRVFTAPGQGATEPGGLASHYGGEAVADPHAALARALALTPVGGTLLLTGSLYLAGALRGALVGG
ncbi:cyanophycin synthetase [Deinococcus sp.]|uniref:glutamate ligase domain-containing protein n=1 Tax=Deinococcus sp. TaxID=47478 RepID=UPI0025F96A69|nr:cyanophycin synthetase [Deinococcus sp.]